MAIGNLYVRSADGRVEAYWTGGAGTGTLEYSLDSGGLSGWTVASSSITGTDNHYAHTLANSTTARWWRYSEGGAPITFADAAYAHSGTFRDPDGWSVIPLGVGKKCIFVASASATPAGNDANSGLTPNSPVLTYGGGIGVGMNAGDHMLFHRGDTFNLSASIYNWPNGASAIAKSMIGAYGPVTVAKPHFICNPPGGSGTGFNAFAMEHGGGAGVSNNCLMSLHVTYASRVDDNQNSFWVFSYAAGQDGVHCEDLSDDGAAGSLVVQVAGGFRGVNGVFRRCMFAHAHNASTGTGDHCQAIFIDAYDGALVEDLVLVENGRDYTGGLSVYSHNLYITEHCSNITARNILAIRGDMQTRPGGLWERLCVIESQLGFTAGGISANGGGQFSEDAIYRDCLIDGSAGTPGWGFWTRDGTNTTNGSTATITLKDTLINLESLDGGTTVGALRQPYQKDGTFSTETQVMDGVVIPRSSSATSDYGLVHLEKAPAVFRMVRCVIDAINSRGILSEASATHPSWQLGSNSYYTARTDQATYGGWFFNQNGVTGRTFAQWQSYVGDPTTGTSASQKLGSAPTFTALRRVTDYCTSIGLDATVDALSTACLDMRKGQLASGHWDVRLTAEYITDWVRQGYGMPALLGGGTSALPPTVQNQVPLMWRRLHNHRRHR